MGVALLRPPAYSYPIVFVFVTCAFVLYCNRTTATNQLHATTAAATERRMLSLQPAQRSGCC